LATAIVFSSSCASKSAPAIRAGLGENFELHIGQSAIVDALALEVVFGTVIADSRCAKGDTCVWEGDAVARLRLQQRGSPQESVDLHTTANGRGSATVDGYCISLLALAPSPVSGRTISASQYVVTLKVTADGAGDKTFNRL
jgi:hypothetical protein